MLKKMRKKSNKVQWMPIITRFKGRIIFLAIPGKFAVNIHRAQCDSHYVWVYRWANVVKHGQFVSKMFKKWSEKVDFWKLLTFWDENLASTIENWLNYSNFSFDFLFFFPASLSKPFFSTKHQLSTIFNDILTSFKHFIA